MARSKRKVGTGFTASGEPNGAARDPGASGERTARKPRVKPRPRREMREKIELRNDERSLTRELSDWDSY